MVETHLVAAGALERLSDMVAGIQPRPHRVAIVTDSVVGQLYADRVARLLRTFDPAVFTVPSGEQHKTRDTWTRVTDEMLSAGLGRDSAVIALGGGVVGDMAGFVAATFMRGVPVVQVPTSLLAMVDASIGGKTAVDTPAGKNLVGAFHPAAAVIVDTTLLKTLPVDHLRAGFAEIVKHGVIADASYFERLASFAGRIAPFTPETLPELTAIIERSVQIKMEVVSRDERESGVRRILNFGHTIGHAVESATGFETLHGHAVAIGLVTEARLAELLGVADAGTAGAIGQVCEAARLPTRVPQVPVDLLLRFMFADKKRRAGRLEFALPSRIGAMAGADRGWTVQVDESDVRKILSD